MIYRQKERFQKQFLLFMGIALLVFILLGWLLLQIRNEHITTFIEERAYQTKQKIEAPNMNHSLENELAILPDVIDYVVIDSQEQNYIKGDRRLLSYYQDNLSLTDNEIQTGTTLRNFWVHMSIFENQTNYHVLCIVPKQLFSSYQKQIIWLFIFLILTLSLFIYGIFRSLRGLLVQAVNDMTNSLSSIEVFDSTNTSFSYSGGYIKELDELGVTVQSLEYRISQRYRELINSEQRLTILLDHINLGVVLIDSMGRIELFNPEASEILGLTDHSYNRTYVETIRSTQLVEMIETVIDSGVSLTDEVELYIPKSLYVDVNIIPYLENEANEGAVLMLLYDISQVQRLENIRSEFVANASHELRTPVTSIKGFAETLKDGALNDSVIAEQFIDIIHHESIRLENIINDILELSRVEKQKDTAPDSVFSIEQVIQTVLVSIQKKARMKKIELIAEIEEDAPLMMLGNRHRVEQILTNLVDNAINYSYEESQVLIRAYSGQDGIKLEVQDFGVGIPDEEQVRIFERFYRVDKGRSRVSGGTGLGLSIVRNLVRIFGGEISVKSKLGEGSTFIVYLPYQID